MLPALNLPIADAIPHLENSMVHGLAVAVGGAAGYLVTFAILWLIGKVAFNRQMPLELRRMICLLGAIAIALVIWILLFDHAAEGG